MRQKIGWLTLLMTLAFWAGCAGENQNYKINEEQTPLFQENYPTQPTGGASADEPSSPDAEPGPSLDGLERDHWERVVIAPLPGRVPHRPHYFSEEGIFGEPAWRISEERPTPLLADADLERQADRATRGARARFDAEQVGDALLGPPKFAADLLTFPYKRWRTPPWRIVSTPEHP